MSYEPTTWKDGDLVTSAKLNKLEQGVAAGGGMMVVYMNPETGTLDKTWQEICDGGFGVVMMEIPYGLCYEPIIKITNENGSFIITTIALGSEGFETFLYKTQSSNGYPVWQDPDDNDQELPK